MNNLKLEYLDLDKIDISPFNVRKSNLNEGLGDLANSIKEIGVQQPIVVFRKGDRYELIIGQRRYLACKQLGKEKIPAIITDVGNETEATIKSFSENIHRLDLEYRDKMQVAAELLAKLGSVEEVAKHLGISPQTARNYLGYAGVEEDIKKMVDERKLGATTALLIARNISDKRQAVEIAKKIKEIPRSEDKRKIIYAQKENPDKTVDDIVEIVKKQKLKHITIDLTPKLSEALEKACQEYGKGAEDLTAEDLAKDIAVESLEDWLKKRGFLK